MRPNEVEMERTTLQAPSLTDLLPGLRAALKIRKFCPDGFIIPKRFFWDDIGWDAMEDFIFEVSVATRWMAESVIGPAPEPKTSWPDISLLRMRIERETGDPVRDGAIVFACISAGHDYTLWIDGKAAYVQVDVGLRDIRKPVKSKIGVRRLMTCEEKKDFDSARHLARHAAAALPEAARRNSSAGHGVRGKLFWPIVRMKVYGGCARKLAPMMESYVTAGIGIGGYGGSLDKADDLDAFRFLTSLDIARVFWKLYKPMAEKEHARRVKKKSVHAGTLDGFGHMSSEYWTRQVERQSKRRICEGAVIIAAVEHGILSRRLGISNHAELAVIVKRKVKEKSPEGSEGSGKKPGEKPGEKPGKKKTL
jgi:hypothetical protein